MRFLLLLLFSPTYCFADSKLQADDLVIASYQIQEETIETSSKTPLPLKTALKQMGVWPLKRKSFVTIIRESQEYTVHKKHIEKLPETSLLVLPGDQIELRGRL